MIFSSIGVVIFILASLADILYFDQVTERVKPQVYWLGIGLVIIGQMI